MTTLSLISFNVFSFQKIRNYTNKYHLFNELIAQYNPDILLLQEDLIHLSQYPYDYGRLTGLPTNEGLMNTILVRTDLLNDPTLLVYGSRTLATDKNVDVSRSASGIAFKGITICNLHLSGGRTDDTCFKEIIDLRDRQILPFRGYDIIAGDFNGNPDEERFPTSHPVFIEANAYDKLIFKEYFKSGHRPLLEAGLMDIPINQPTDAFGGNPDHIYYNPSKLNPLYVEVIDMLTLDLSDHNALYVKFHIL